MSSIAAGSDTNLGFMGTFSCCFCTPAWPGEAEQGMGDRDHSHVHRQGPILGAVGDQRARVQAGDARMTTIGRRKRGRPGASVGALRPYLLLIP